MNLTYGIISAVIIIAIIGIFIFTNAQSKATSNTLGLLITPTIDLNQPFQPYTASGQNTQAQQTQQQNQSQEQIPTIAATFQANTSLPATVSATIHTTKGDIQIKLFNSLTPKTVSNFVEKIKSNYYNNLLFHRVEDWVVQGGDPNGDGTGGGNMPVEFTTTPFIVGSLGMASRGDNQVQNDSQFFITKTPADWLNNKYTNFGIVTDGMDIVNKIAIGDKIKSMTVYLTQTEGGQETSP